MRNYLFYLIASLIFFIKFIAFLIIKSNKYILFGGGNDADYYDNYALGIDNFAVNFWPEILRFFYNFGIYSRDGFSFLLFLMSSVLLPAYIGKLTKLRNDEISARAYVYSFVVIATYPQLFFLSIDIYRDIFMVMIYIFGIFAFKNISLNKFSLSIYFHYCIAILIGFVLFKFRNYLGFGFFVALFFSKFFDFSKINLKISLILFFISMQIFCYLGIFDDILKYRYIFDDMEGESNLNIRFEDENLFIFYFLKNLFIQIFGFYFNGFKSIIAFFLESVPFIVSFVYLVGNRKYSNKFVDYLIVFFISYSSIFLIGNDNLGSATRLRIFSYISVYISCFIVYQNKRLDKISRFEKCN
ncbi:hypothetical protein INP81_21215 [Comamonas thiooxydans]|uniref:hypothetical protein n=1 Tax=Comamonas thiooxydans TaxID=363952 RepID=UPI0018A4FFCB|nr:hypothetical protein [Comamonas thiooxydans]QOQ81810.1 hypothetical protein INP81_21215 [Comamonas thiooxydans]